MKIYKISDKLQNLINWDKIMPLPRYAGGHDDQMKYLFKDSKLIGHWNEGDWQGSVATCVQIKSGEYVIYNDSYGSCSGCDSWEDADDGDIRSMCIDLANGAYIFNNLADVKKFLKNENDEFTEGNFDWFNYGEASHLLHNIENGIID